MWSLRCFAIAGLLAAHSFLLGCGSSSVATPAPASVIERGEEIFQRTAGGVGCASCHGIDARGIHNSGPQILEREAKGIQRALARVSQMGFISLTDDDLDAVAAYLQFLQSQR